MTQKITIMSARCIHTLSAHQPTATHIAIKGTKILGTGNLEDLAGWGEYELDEQFSDKILMPGFVEGHSHIMEGGLWKSPYVGYYPRYGPDGMLHESCRSIDDTLARLSDISLRMNDAHTPLIAWGFDPIFFGGERMNRQQLDQVSSTRPILILHASVHLCNVNSVTLEQASIDQHTDVEGVVKDAAGEPTGELQEPAAMFPAFEVTGADFFHCGEDPMSVRNLAMVARQAGVTTATDLLADCSDEMIENYVKETADEELPLRLVPALAGLDLSVEEGLRRLSAAKKKASDKLHFGLVKLFTDGSIQGFTARLNEPGYYNGSPNGLWMTPPEQLFSLVEGYHRAGCTLHIHANGDEASSLALDAIGKAIDAFPRADHRHTLQHCQVASSDQYRRMKSLGVCVNLFANHIYFWGDQHVELTLGHERASRMNACATALSHGIPLAIHSDAPITPLAPLFTAWCAVNRQTATGCVLGELEKIDIVQAMHAITLGAAYTLRLDHMIGSLEPGKFADMAVLEDDPFESAPERLKDIGVWGTVVGGRVFPARA